MTPRLCLILFGVSIALAELFATMNYLLSKMSGGKIKFLEEVDSELAERLEKIFPICPERAFAAHLLVFAFFVSAFYFLGQWRALQPNTRLWLPLLLASCGYWGMSLIAGVLSVKATAMVIISFVSIVRCAVWVFFPLTLPFGAAARRLEAKRHAVSEENDTVPTVEDEILSLVDGDESATTSASSLQSLEEDEKRMIRGALELDDISVRKIMTPRVDINCVEYHDGMELDEFLSVVRSTIIESGHSRIPVYKDSIDNIIGIVYSKDLLDSTRLTDFDAFVRKQLLVIPESKNIGDLLEEFRMSKIHLAIVVDEYGGTAGIVTFEDVLETLVGDIQDEYDYAEGGASLHEVSAGVWHCDARTPVEIINKVVGIELPEDDEYDTIGGYISYEIGRIPLQGEDIETDLLKMHICKADSRRAIEVELSLKDKK